MSAATSTSTARPHADTKASTTGLMDESKPAADGSVVAKAKRTMVGLGKHKDGGDDHSHSASDPAAAAQRLSPTSAPCAPATLLPSPPLTDHRTSPCASPRVGPAAMGASPSRRSMRRSTSPGLHSPASSAIFERNVQEPEESTAIPAHIKTEDHIPPALDASSLAITDDGLDPDEVEIVMHAAHLPASTAVAGGMAESVYAASLAYDDVMASSHADANEHTPNYGSLDMTDPRRLSFISFADVVQAEQVEQDREMAGSSEALQFQSLSSTASAVKRSPSPVTSAASSRGMSPATSGAASPRFASHGRTRSPGSPMSPIHGTGSPAVGSGEPPLQIETMRQALRKTHSGDLSGHRSQPLSALSLEDGHGERAPFR
ncbi:hypothetical protein ACEQ8H_000654 [Pleosporales sp. CAS-2024a]